MYVNTIIGIILFVLSNILYLFSISQLNKYDTPVAHGETITRMVTSGIFGYTRNPMFVAMIIMGLATAIMANSAIGLIPVVVYLLYLQLLVIPREEAVLRRIYGKEYQRYCSRVPRWLVW